MADLEVSRRHVLRGSGVWTLIAVCFGVMMVGLDATVVAIANPYIARGLHANLSDLQWVTNGYLLVTAVLLIPAGKLGDLLGRRRIYMIGMAGFALSSLGVGVSHSIAIVIMFRCFQGLFGAFIMPNTLAILRNTFPIEKLNGAIGVWGGVSAIAIAGGPIVAGFLVQDLSWQSVFFLNLPVAAIGLMISAACLLESRDKEVGRVDWAGVGSLALSLFLLVFGLIKTQTWGWGSDNVIALFIGAVVVGVVFVWTEMRVKTPLLPLRLFRSRLLSFATVVIILDFFAFYGVIFFISLYLQEVHGYSPIEAGVRLLPLTLMFVISAPVGALLNQRLGPRFPVSVGMLLEAIGLSLMLDLRVNSEYSLLVAAFVLSGLGVGFVLTATSDAIVASAPRGDAGVAGGLQSTALQIGGVLGTAVLGSVLLSQVGAVLVGKFTALGLPASLSHGLLAAKALIAEGAVPKVSGASPRLEGLVVIGSHRAFMSGLHVAMVVAVIVSLIGFVLGLLMGSHTTGHESVLEGEPHG